MQTLRSTLFPYTTLFRSDSDFVRGFNPRATAAERTNGAKCRPHRRGWRGATNSRRYGNGERSEEHTSELQSPCNLVCRLLLEKKKRKLITYGVRIFSKYM